MVICKDCLDEFGVEVNGAKVLPLHLRPRPLVPGSGRRCATHWRDEKKRRKGQTHEKRVQKEYGLKPGEYGQLYLAQGGQCAFGCGATGASRKLSVDHDHKTGLVRGLLCRPCNDLLGHLRDDPERARLIITYLVDPPARRLGITAVHKEMREE